MDFDGLDIVDEVKMGIVMPGQDRQTILDTARKVEASGLDSIWVGDHIAFHIPVVESLNLLSHSSPRRPNASNSRRVSCYFSCAIRP